MLSNIINMNIKVQVVIIKNKEAEILLGAIKVMEILSVNNIDNSNKNHSNNNKLRIMNSNKNSHLRNIIIMILKLKGITITKLKIKGKEVAAFLKNFSVNKKNIGVNIKMNSKKKLKNMNKKDMILKIF